MNHTQIAPQRNPGGVRDTLLQAAAELEARRMLAEGEPLFPVWIWPCQHRLGYRLGLHTIAMPQQHVFGRGDLKLLDHVKLGRLLGAHAISGNSSGREPVVVVQIGEQGNDPTCKCLLKERIIKRVRVYGRITYGRVGSAL